MIPSHDSNVRYVPIPVRMAADLCEYFGKDQIIIVAWDGVFKKTHITTFGVSPSDKLQAVALRDRIIEALGLSQTVTVYEDFRDAKQAAENAAQLDKVLKENAELRRQLMMKGSQ